MTTFGGAMGTSTKTQKAKNTKYRKENGLPDHHDLLPPLPQYTDKQRERIRTHFTPKPKPLTLTEKLENMHGDLKALLNLKKPSNKVTTNGSSTEET